MSEADPKCSGILLRWPIKRRGRSFRVYVVEPWRYVPGNHDALFQRVLTGLMRPMVREVQPGGKTQAHQPDFFDLVTFPEAFLSPSGLQKTLEAVNGIDSLGCVHVGLRSGNSTQTHLMRVDEIKTLLDSVSSIPTLCTEDLTAFGAWLDHQLPADYFNVGCLFAIDRERRLRVCFHPKMVRARVELSVASEHTMKEGTLLTAVILMPNDKAYPSVAIQPVLCSDVLALDVDRPMRRPLVLINTDADCLGEEVPDQIDLVSVATCTPVQAVESQPGRESRWHDRFVSEFARIQLELPRHQSSVFVLSNFTEISFPKGARPGGLSGLFFPRSRELTGDFPTYLSPYCYWRTQARSEFWAFERDLTKEERPNVSELGFVAGLSPDALDRTQQAHVLGFTIHRMIRDCSGWYGESRLTGIELYAVDQSGTMNLARTTS